MAFAPPTGRGERREERAFAFAKKDVDAAVGVGGSVSLSIMSVLSCWIRARVVAGAWLFLWLQSSDSFMFTTPLAPRGGPLAPAAIDAEGGASSLDVEPQWTGTRPGMNIESVYTADAEPPLPPGEEQVYEYPMPVHAFLRFMAPLEFQTRTSSKSAVRRGEVLINGVQATNESVVSAGDVVQRQTRSQPSFAPMGKSPFPVDVLFEDDHFAVVIKPPGVSIHGSSVKDQGDGCSSKSRMRMFSALPYVLQPSRAGSETLARPQHVHRLDAPTGGLLICAKTRPALKKLSEDFQERRIRKRYRALVCGKLEGSGSISSPLGGKHAETVYSVPTGDSMCVRSLHSGFITTVDIWPQTGRTHQIRRHMAGLGVPLLGDKRYTPPGMALLEGEGLFLWAVGLDFQHPITQEPISLSIPEPEKFVLWRVKEHSRWQKFHSEEDETAAAAHRKTAGVSSLKELDALPDLPGLEVIERDGFRYYNYNGPPPPV
jgi:23S rRNA pseudouridine1911/1915/1917 synthase